MPDIKFPGTIVFESDSEESRVRIDHHGRAIVDLFYSRGEGEWYTPPSIGPATDDASRVIETLKLYVWQLRRDAERAEDDDDEVDFDEELHRDPRCNDA